MKKILSLLLAVVLVLSLAACGGNNEPTTEPTTQPTTAPTTQPTTKPTTAPTTEPTTQPITEPAGDNALYAFSMSVMENWEPTVNLYISDNGDGTVFVEYMGEVRKQSFAFDGAALTKIADALAAQDLTVLGEGAYEEGSKSFSLSVTYADFSTFDYSGSGEEVPAAFNAILTAMDTAFQTALADLEVYVPQLTIYTEMNPAIEAEMLDIMNNSGIANLEALGAMEISMEDAESFNFTAGLSSNDGITAGGICQTMMMGGAAFQLVIVALEDEANAAAVAADFEANADFGKWVCVRPDQGLIAQKGNLVLCLMGPNDMFTGTADAITGAGWTTVKTLTDTGM